jgi:hypothetical protein
MNDKLIVTDSYAYFKLPLHLVVLNDHKEGFRVSVEAKINLQESRSGHNVYFVEYENEKIWVGESEYSKYGLKEL